MRTLTHSTRFRLSLAIVAAGFVFGLTTRGHSAADASTYVLMTDSLWNDGDLVYGPEDYARAVALHYDVVPAGLILSKHDWGYGYGKPFVYPTVAVAFYAAFGPRGFFILNGVLLAAVLLLCADVLSHRLPWTRAVVAAAAVIGLSVTPIYVEWIDPFLTCSVLAAASLAAYRRQWAACSGVSLAVLAACRPPYAVLAGAPVVLYLLARDWRRLARFAAAGAAVAMLYLAVSIASGEAWTAYAAQRLYYTNVFPYDGGDVAGIEVGYPTDDLVGERPWPGAQDIAEVVEEFLIGRFAGVLIYFPGLVACLLWSRRWDREKLVWAGALLAACAAIFVAFPQNYFGGSHAIGNRLFTLLPVACVFVDFVAWRPWRALATVALATLVLPLVRAPVMLSHGPGRQMAWAPYRYLPLEWAYVRRLQPPYTFPGMAALTDNQYFWERTGVWTRGDTSAQFVFVRPPGRQPRVRLTSPLTDVRLTDGYTPVEWKAETFVLELTHPVAVTRDKLQSGDESSVYVLTIATDSIFRPRAGGDSKDNRYLGVFVEPIDRSPPQRDPAARVNRPQLWWLPPES